MECPKCGYAVTELDQDCPRCRRGAPSDPGPKPPAVAAASARSSAAAFGRRGLRLLAIGAGILVVLLVAGVALMSTGHRGNVQVQTTIFPICNDAEAFSCTVLAPVGLTKEGYEAIATQIIERQGRTSRIVSVQVFDDEWARQHVRDDDTTAEQDTYILDHLRCLAVSNGRETTYDAGNH